MPRPESVYRRRVLGAGSLAAFTLFVVGAPIVNNRIEADLERRVSDELAAAGHTGVTVRFSGQDATLACSGPLDDPEGAIDVAYGVHGVHSIELDRACRVTTAPGAASATTVPSATGAPSLPASPETTTAASVPVYATVGDVVANDAMFSALARFFAGSPTGAALSDPAGTPIALLAPTDAAFAALSADADGALAGDAELREQVLRDHVLVEPLTVDQLRQRAGGTVATLNDRQLEVAVVDASIVVGGAPIVGDPIETDAGLVYPLGAVLLPDGAAGLRTGAPIDISLADGAVALTGTVATETDRRALVAAAEAAVGATNVTDELAVDAVTGTDPDTIAAIGDLLTALDTHLVNGTTGFDGTRLYLAGRYPDTAGAEGAQTAADAVGARIDVTERPTLDAERALTLETELNEFVVANPIVFQPGSAILDESARAVLDRLAARLREYGGLTAVIEGHTDSDGQAATNLTLSERRAAVVRQAMIDRGVDAESMTAAGFGSTRPVLVNGLEDKTASRRVEFRISATP